MKKELLSPAGDIEAGYAALYYGADAVYLGLKQFSARSTALNFSDDELADFVGYAHSLQRKVYVTINTVLQENELPDLLRALDVCRSCHVDAIILQDWGVARVIKESYPELALHASTQMAVHNKEEAQILKDYGFKRIVLARELTLPEIREIAKIPDLELEVFIHGALCYSYSGLCLFSSMAFGKSANRGKCAYPCRDCFGEKHLFSMKDLALQSDILKLPVTSLKIEGRKKNALYVAAVTDYYRGILDSRKADADKEKRIKQIFSRPWTKLHVLGKNKDVIDTEFVGHRGLPIGCVEIAFRDKISFKTKEDIARYDGIQIDIEGKEKPFGFSLEKMLVQGKKTFEAKSGDNVDVFLPSNAPFIPKGSAIYLASSTSVKGSYPYEKPKPNLFKIKPEIDVKVRLRKESISAESGDFTVQCDGKFEKANNPQKVEQGVLNCFSKTGDEAFCLGKLSFENSDGVFVPVSVLNDLRRQLYSKIVLDRKKRTLPPLSEKHTVGKKKWIIKTDDVPCLSLINFDDLAEIIVMLTPQTTLDSFSFLPKSKVRLGLPVVCRSPEKFKGIIEKALSAGYKKWEISHLWAMKLLPSKGVDISFDSFVYTVNSQSIQNAKEMGASRVTLSVEDTLANMKQLTEKTVLPLVAIAYQDVPLFISANCIRRTPCAGCSGKPEWFDLKQYQALSVPCETYVFKKEAYTSMPDALDLDVDFYRADFAFKKYTPEQVKEIFDDLRNGHTLTGTYQGNLRRISF